jgi:hypothetical protein
VLSHGHRFDAKRHQDLFGLAVQQRLHPQRQEGAPSSMRGPFPLLELRVQSCSISKYWRVQSCSIYSICVCNAFHTYTLAAKYNLQRRGFFWLHFQCTQHAFPYTFPQTPAGHSRELAGCTSHHSHKHSTTGENSIILCYALWSIHTITDMYYLLHASYALLHV